MTHRPHLSLHGVGAIIFSSWSHLVFLQGKVNSVCYIAQVVNPMLLPFLRQEGHVLFQQDNACPHMAAAMQCALHGVQQLPWPARSPDVLQARPPDVCQLNLTGHDDTGTYSFSRACHNHCRILTMGKRCLGQSITG